MKSTTPRIFFIFACFLAGISAAQTVNPKTDIRWPLISASGTPTATGAACLVTNVGQPYQNTAVTPNTQYHCAQESGPTYVWELNIGGSYTLPIATTSILGGVKPDGTTCQVNGTTGVLTCAGAGLPTTGGTMTGPIYFSGSGINISSTGVTIPVHSAFGAQASVDQAFPDIVTALAPASVPLSTVWSLDETSTTAAGINGILGEVSNSPVGASGTSTPEMLSLLYNMDLDSATGIGSNIYSPYALLSNINSDTVGTKEFINLYSSTSVNGSAPLSNLQGIQTEDYNDHATIGTHIAVNGGYLQGSGALTHVAIGFETGNNGGTYDSLEAGFVVSTPEIGVAPGVHGIGSYGYMSIGPQPNYFQGAVNAYGGMGTGNLTATEITVAQMAAPTSPSCTTNPTGGTITPGTLYFEIAATDDGTHWVTGAESSQAVTGTQTVTCITASPTLGASAYRLYWGTSTGAENQYEPMTIGGWQPDHALFLSVIQYTVTQNTGTSGTPPSGNTTGNLYLSRQAASGGDNCLQIDTTGFVTNTGSACGSTPSTTGIAYWNGSAWGTPLAKYGSAAGVATSSDPGITAEVPMVADGSHGQKPSASGALGTGAFAAVYGTWGALNYPTWVSATPFVKMTAAGTFSLDTNTYANCTAGTSASNCLVLDGSAHVPAGNLTAANSPATPLPTPGSSISLSAPRGYAVCTTTCTVTLPTPAAGDEFCTLNDDNVSTVITIAAISGVYFEKIARTGYETVNTAMTSGGAVGDRICMIGRDATHYLTLSYNGTWTP
jgi:hypothetical protein